MYVIECAQVSTKSEMMEEGNVANGTYGVPRMGDAMRSSKFGAAGQALTTRSMMVQGKQLRLEE